MHLGEGERVLCKHTLSPYQSIQEKGMEVRASNAKSDERYSKASPLTCNAKSEPRDGAVSCDFVAGTFHSAAAARKHGKSLWQWAVAEAG